MSQTQTVVINGRLYDALTGMPVVASTAKEQPVEKAVFAPQSRASSQNASKIHSHMQRSQTLNRKHTKKPAAVQPAAAAAPKPTVAEASSVKPRQTVAKSPAITRFAPHPKPLQKTQPAAPQNNVRRKMDIAPVNHPTAVKAHQIQAQKAAAQRPVVKPVQAEASAKPVVKAAHPPAKVLKESAIEQALKNAPSKKEQRSPKKRSFFARNPRLMSIASASLALVMLGGYFTYLNMPNLSVRVAATQAGIDAKYPDYQPDGYSLNGPVAAENGKVEMKFASNAGPQNFVITQAKSSWDSSAVVDNVVKPQSNDSYVTTNERGLTIYTYKGNAAWVNGGILYTIEGDAPLSSEQIRKIATSL